MRRDVGSDPLQYLSLKNGAYGTRLCVTKERALSPESAHSRRVCNVEGRGGMLQRTRYLLRVSVSRST